MPSYLNRSSPEDLVFFVLCWISLNAIPTSARMYRRSIEDRLLIHARGNLRDDSKSAHEQQTVVESSGGMDTWNREPDDTSDDPLIIDVTAGVAQQCY